MKHSYFSRRLLSVFMAFALGLSVLLAKDFVVVIMIGRATIGRPWIFKEIIDFLQGKEVEPISKSEQLSLYGVVNTISNALSLRDPCRTEYALMTRLLSQFLCGKVCFFMPLPKTRKERLR